MRTTKPAIGAAWLHDPVLARWLYFSEPVAQLSAEALSDVAGVVAEAEAAVARDLWAVGWVAYEAAGAFDPALLTRPPAEGLPLAWFGLYRPPHVEPTPPLTAPLTLPTTPDLGEGDFIDRIRQIKAAIACGDTYQVNLTFRLDTAFTDDPWRVFSQLQGAQPGGYGAYLDLGTHVVASASPELFWRLDGESIHMRPMKGTRPRGRWPAEDEALASELSAATKDRAENVMIVDMARNDLGKIATIGSVQVPELFTVERYPTVWQMTSTLSARTRGGLSEILRACFPCASITGAPKASTMRLIRSLEDTSRGVYTGALGYWAPGRRAQFSVAIRTAVIDRQRERLRYGVGSGIVWDSIATDEYHECLLKGRPLTQPVESFELIETLRWTPEQGFWLEDAHLERLERSARRFDIPVDRAASRHALHAAVEGAAEARRVRLTLNGAGLCRVTTAAAPAAAWRAADPARAPLALRLAPAPIDRQDIWLYHKTTRRAVYDAALAAARAVGPCDDVILWNDQGEVTETTIGNLIIEHGGRRLTPPVSAGLLPGTFRGWLVERGEVEEWAVTRTMLVEATALWRVNGLRGWEAARLAGP